MRLSRRLSPVYTRLNPTRETRLRNKIVEQPELRFTAPRLKLTQEFYAKYDRISRILDDNRGILDLVHADLVAHAGEGDPGRFRYASDVVLRVGVCQLVEGLSLRQTIVRIDTCEALRDFTRIESGTMIDYSTFCRLRNAISPKTWVIHCSAYVSGALDSASLMSASRFC